METVISVKHLSKKYRRYASVSGVVKEALHPFRKKYHEEFWALKDVSFDLKKGESLGIVGRNGSGKSTLLQILCGIMQPTGGEVSVKGKISALLQLGAGFHPNFSGRENVYLNGALMGYKKEEIDAKFDEIASFADIGDFLDQPVRTYSSGMFVRLAFATAINVDPDILIIDEALSVGDIRFQQKCYRKISEFREKGSTIILITHDMAAIKNFCTVSAWVNEGRIFKMGSPDEVVKAYSSFMYQDGKGVSIGGAHRKTADGIDWEELNECASYGEGGARIRRAVLYRKGITEKAKVFSGAEPVIIKLDMDIKKNMLNPFAGFILKDKYGNHILGLNTHTVKKPLPAFKDGERVLMDLEFMLPKLKNGEYVFSFFIAEGTQAESHQHHWVHDAYDISVINDDEACNMDWYLVIDQADIRLKSESIA